LEKVAEELRQTNRRAMVLKAHLGRFQDVQEVVSNVKGAFGRIDILVNNAAANPTISSAIDVEEHAWDSIMNLNLKGLFFLSQGVARIMKEEGGGCIINVSSLLGIRPDVLLPVYSISKAAVIMATKVMAQEWGEIWHKGERGGSGPVQNQVQRSPLVRSKNPRPVCEEHPDGTYR